MIPASEPLATLLPLPGSPPDTPGPPLHLLQVGTGGTLSGSLSWATRSEPEHWHPHTWLPCQGPSAPPGLSARETGVSRVSCFTCGSANKRCLMNVGGMQGLNTPSMSDSEGGTPGRRQERQGRRVRSPWTGGSSFTCLRTTCAAGSPPGPASRGCEPFGRAGLSEQAAVPMQVVQGTPGLTQRPMSDDHVLSRTTVPGDAWGWTHFLRQAQPWV